MKFAAKRPDTELIVVPTMRIEDSFIIISLNDISCVQLDATGIYIPLGSSQVEQFGIQTHNGLIRCRNFGGTMENEYKGED